MDDNRYVWKKHIWMIFDGFKQYHIDFDVRVPWARVVSMRVPGGMESAEVTAWPSTRVIE